MFKVVTDYEHRDKYLEVEATDNEQLLNEFDRSGKKSEKKKKKKKDKSSSHYSSDKKHKRDKKDKKSSVLGKRDHYETSVKDKKHLYGDTTIKILINDSINPEDID